MRRRRVLYPMPSVPFWQLKPATSELGNCWCPCPYSTQVKPGTRVITSLLDTVTHLHYARTIIHLHSCLFGINTFVRVLAQKNLIPIEWQFMCKVDGCFFVPKYSKLIQNLRCQGLWDIYIVVTLTLNTCPIALVSI